jgi:hypothetical protein
MSQNQPELSLKVFHIHVAGERHQGVEELILHCLIGFRVIAFVDRLRA